MVEGEEVGAGNNGEAVSEVEVEEVEISDEEMKNKMDELRQGEEKMEMQRDLDYVEEEKEKTLAESLAEYKASNDIELKEKIPKNEIDFQNHAVEVSKLFILCFKDFRNRFKYCDEAQEIILKLDSACSVLILWNMEYSGGFELGDCIAEQNIKRIIGENYFPIDDFMKLYAEVKEA